MFKKPREIYFNPQPQLCCFRTSYRAVPLSAACTIIRSHWCMPSFKGGGERAKAAGKFDMHQSGLNYSWSTMVASSFWDIRLTDAEYQNRIIQRDRTLSFPVVARQPSPDPNFAPHAARQHATVPLLSAYPAVSERFGSACIIVLQSFCRNPYIHTYHCVKRPLKMSSCRYMST